MLLDFANERFTKLWFATIRILLYAEITLRGHLPFEGTSRSEGLAYLYATAKRLKGARVAETGFHFGCSSYAFLKVKETRRVFSFDLGHHNFIQTARKIINRKFPRRHSLILGDSKKTVPEFARDNPNVKVDITFIDGGHDFETALADLRNMKLLAHPGDDTRPPTIVIIDDVLPWEVWGKEPMQAWQQAIDEGLIVHHAYYQDGKVVDLPRPPGKRAWAVGQYIF